MNNAQIALTGSLTPALVETTFDLLLVSLLVVAVSTNEQGEPTASYIGTS